VDDVSLTVGQGSVRLFGTSVTAGRRAAYADVDAMPEGVRNNDWRLTVRGNLRYFPTIHGVDPDTEFQTDMPAAYLAVTNLRE
jgi:ABC-type multidrug transport system ATPase subunit